LQWFHWFDPLHHSILPLDSQSALGPPAAVL
jgi:hypothetical protein